MRYQKYFIFAIVLVFGTILTAQPTFAKIWTKSLVDKVVLSSGYGATICPIDTGMSGKDLMNAPVVIDETPGGSLTAGLSSQEADFVKNPDNYKCTGPSESILLGNVDLYFKQDSANSAREHLLMYQNDVMSFSNVSYEYYDKNVSLSNVDSKWFTNAKGLRRISGSMLMYTSPDINESKRIVPDSRLDLFFAEDGHNVATLLVYQGITYKVVDIIKKVTEPTILIDYTSAVNDTVVNENNKQLSKEDMDSIKKALAQKTGQTVDNFSTIFDSNNIDTFQGQFASGQMSQSSAGLGGKWYAAKVDNAWLIVDVTQSELSCELATKYNLPRNLVSECLDQNNKLIDR